MSSKDSQLLERTVGCGEVTEQDAASRREIVLTGWVHRRRDLGQLIFVELRDRTGFVQVVIDPVTHAAPPRRVGDFDVPFGWAVASWIDRLRFLARVCIHPCRAAELCEWADGLEQTLKEETT